MKRFSPKILLLLLFFLFRNISITAAERSFPDYGKTFSPTDLTAEYNDFLNAAAVVNHDDLFNEKMGAASCSLQPTDYNLFLRSGAPGSYHYSLINQDKLKPLTFVSLLDQAMFWYWEQHHELSEEGVQQLLEQELLFQDSDPLLKSNLVALKGNPFAILSTASSSKQNDQWSSAEILATLFIVFGAPAAYGVRESCLQRNQEWQTRGDINNTHFMNQSIRFRDDRPVEGLQAQEEIEHTIAHQHPHGALGAISIEQMTSPKSLAEQYRKAESDHATAKEDYNTAWDSFRVLPQSEQYLSAVPLLADPKKALEKAARALNKQKCLLQAEEGKEIYLRGSLAGMEALKKLDIHLSSHADAWCQLLNIGQEAETQPQDEAWISGEKEKILKEIKAQIEDLPNRTEIQLHLDLIEKGFPVALQEVENATASESITKVEEALANMKLLARVPANIAALHEAIRDCEERIASLDNSNQETDIEDDSASVSSDSDTKTVDYDSRKSSSDSDTESAASREEAMLTSFRVTQEGAQQTLAKYRELSQKIQTGDSETIFTHLENTDREFHIVHVGQKSFLCEELEREYSQQAEKEAEAISRSLKKSVLSASLATIFQGCYDVQTLVRKLEDIGEIALAEKFKPIEKLELAAKSARKAGKVFDNLFLLTPSLSIAGSEREALELAGGWLLKSAHLFATRLPENDEQAVYLREGGVALREAAWSFQQARETTSPQAREAYSLGGNYKIQAAHIVAAGEQGKFSQARSLAEAGSVQDQAAETYKEAAESAFPQVRKAYEFAAELQLQLAQLYINNPNQEEPQEIENLKKAAGLAEAASRNFKDEATVSIREIFKNKTAVLLPKIQKLYHLAGEWEVQAAQLYAKHTGQGEVLQAENLDNAAGIAHQAAYYFNGRQWEDSKPLHREGYYRGFSYHVREASPKEYEVFNQALEWASEGAKLYASNPGENELQHIANLGKAAEIMQDARESFKQAEKLVLSDLISPYNLENNVPKIRNMYSQIGEWQIKQAHLYAADPGEHGLRQIENWEKAILIAKNAGYKFRNYRIKENTLIGTEDRLEEARRYAAIAAIP